MNLDDYLMAGTYYRIKFLEPEQMSEGGIALPENALPDSQSGVVLAHGPGRLLDSGARYPMQCGIGDVVVARPCDFDPVGDGEAFVADERLVAYRVFDPKHAPGEDPYSPLLAANDWVLVRPDAAKEVDPVTGATVAAGNSPVLMVTASVGGGEVREDERGEELVRIAESITRSQRYREAANEYERHRILHDFYDSFSHWEHLAFQRALDRKGPLKSSLKVPMRRLHRATAGTVLYVGPGLVDSWLNPWQARARQPEATRTQRDDKYRIQCDGYFEVEPLEIGDRVHFERGFKAVALFAEEGSVWAVRARHLCAVETAE
jgi:co-chaperonin GroES (HSP10)